jgi:transketolase
LAKAHQDTIFGFCFPRKRRLGVELKPGARFRVFVLLGDGELNEGQMWEAAMAAAHFRVTNLVAIVDRNQFSLHGRTEAVMALEPLAAKWRAFGWAVYHVDGHRVEEVARVLAEAAGAAVERPRVVIAATVKGKGVSFMEGREEWHLGWLAPPDRERALRELGSSVPVTEGRA